LTPPGEICQKAASKRKIENGEFLVEESYLFLLSRMDD